MFLVRKACVWNADTVIKCLRQSLQNSSQKITRLASDSWVWLLQPLLFVSFQEKNWGVWTPKNCTKCKQRKRSNVYSLLTFMVNFFSLPTFLRVKKHGERSKHLIPCIKEAFKPYHKIFILLKVHTSSKLQIWYWYQLPNAICWTSVLAAIKIMSL